MPSEDELLKEWRAGLTAQIASVGIKLDDLSDRIGVIEITLATNSHQNKEIEVLKTKVEHLEEFKTKFIGGMIALNGLLALVGWGLNHLMK